MERKTSKLEHRERSELEAQQHTQHAPPGRTFESVDELLRVDAAQTDPPANLEERLAQSIASTPPPVRSWWRRWFGFR